MSLSDLASLGSFVSGFAVLISLVYLSLQVRQATKHARAAIGQNRISRTVDMQLRQAEPVLGELTQRGHRGDQTMSASEILRFMAWARAMFFQAEDNFVQHRNGMLTDDFYKGMHGTNVRMMRGAGMQASWEVFREFFHPEFVAYMDGAAHSAKELGYVNVPEAWPALVARHQKAQTLSDTSLSR